MMTRRAHQAVGVVNLTAHDGIDSGQRGASSLDGRRVGLRGDVGVGSKKPGLTVSMLFFPGNLPGYLFDLPYIGAVVHSSQFILGIFAWWNLDQPIPLQPAQSFYNFYRHFKA